MLLNTEVSVTLVTLSIFRSVFKHIEECDTFYIGWDRICVVRLDATLICVCVCVCKQSWKAACIVFRCWKA